MKDLFLNLKNEDLDELKMESYTLINNEEYQNYFLQKSSQEHYRLLTFLSNYFDGVSFVDVGTLLGCSALALAANKTNKVYSFNLTNQLQLKEKPQNVEFIVDDVMSDKYKEIILDSKIILLDTFHTGDFELIFLNYLKKINYNGILILDDIRLNNEMSQFWETINEDKMEITNLGHVSGTGVVFFD